MSSDKVYRWGIIGCGNISNDFAVSLTRYQRSKIVACGARSLEKSQTFAKKWGIPIYNAYDSYDAVSNDPHVDIVYIGTIHPKHYKSVIYALNAGKNVLCEKPIGMNAVETEEMIEAAHKNHKFLMEAMWTRFFPAIRKARALIKAGVIGDIVSYYGNLAALMPTSSEFPRLWQNKLGGGGLLDLGCYPINPLTWIFGPKMPDKIVANGVIDKEFNIDVIAAGSVVYQDTKQYGQFSCNIISNSHEAFAICGKKGRIIIEPPAHCPSKLVVYLTGDTPETKRDVVKVEQYEFKNSKIAKCFYPGSEGLIYQIEAVTKCLDEGRVESPEYTWNEMLVVMKIMDEVRKQIGVSYEADSELRSKL